ncbi:nucleotidyltransferase [Aneurinibacillus uraniidurans]|uniref:nucleotidyltransferase n=1 Tax=Aneurinibacillus uraniidurans TaxID=2966586 RepID=UPI00234BA067|nr:nucleotidyltransferase [Aneurinibacillus sp. B1]WCN39049.1 nucleotidyltransferase [Aneurinibacillus sp. B1]
MRTVGLVVEYNPLHNGHVYHFTEAKKQTAADAAVAVMSGYFLQRGEPAIASKWARTEMALRMGADLVLELPFAYAAQNAEQFAFGAVATLDATGIVDTLCFGSESGHIERIQTLASLLTDEPDAFRTALATELARGVSYPAAYGRAAAQLLGDADAQKDTSEPNNILGLNYCLALRRLKSSIMPATITRQKAGYHDTEMTDTRIASATALRKHLLESGNLLTIAPYVPPSTLAVLTDEQNAGRFPVTWDDFFPHVQHTLLTQTPEQLALIHEMTEGLEHRLLTALPQAAAFHELMESIKTKRYTWTRLQRLLLYSMLHITHDQMKQATIAGPAYIRVLGFSDTGRELLRQMKKTARVPVLTRVPKSKHSLLALDVRAAAVYALAYPLELRLREMQREYWQTPIML